MKRNQQPKAKRGYSAKFLNLKIDFLAKRLLWVHVCILKLYFENDNGNIMSLFKKKK